jgi:hypothetical protein
MRLGLKVVIQVLYSTAREKGNLMGIYSEYLDQAGKLDLIAERKKQLKRIADIRGRDILVYASDPNKSRSGAPVALDNSDLLPIIDQVSNLKRNAVDVLLVTSGGSGETAEDIVRLLYDRFNSVAFIIPSMAKSAGTIMAMAGDEILMEPSSSLGPIDAQIQWEGKVFSAEAFLKGLVSIKQEAALSNSLNRMYIPILQRISPGEIQNAENALSFAKVLVTTWLKEHKFKNWTEHRTHQSGTPVTAEQKEARAKEIADILCDHSRWLSHGRSIKIPDLQSIGLEITDYSREAELADAIRRYHVLLQMTFEGSAVFKLYETPMSQINRFASPALMQIPGGAGQAPGFPNIPVPVGSPSKPSQGQPPATPGVGAPAGVLINFVCPKCKINNQLQADLDFQRALQPNIARFPSNDILVCKNCKGTHVLTQLRSQIEAQTGRKIA